MFIKGIDSEGNKILVNTAYIVTLEPSDNSEVKGEYYYVRLLYRDGFNINSIYVKKEVMEQSQIRGGAVEGFMPD